ncbi:triosephosphate isomerase [Friedmanniomyces endolithicus]|nr:triosephosphate isomerase [Friedmanniomyces endolithicus]
MPRQFFVGGNFKMNGNIETIKSIVAHLNDAKADPNTEVVIAPPSLYLLLTREHLRSGIEVAAQNVFDRPNGAFTGEISVAQLKDSNITWTLLGHSERRVVLQEDDAFVAKKTAAAIDGGIGVILCCGESLEQREADKTIEVVTSQLSAVAKEVKDWSKIVVAYEPIWAIGTGKVATAAQAQEVHAAIRKWLGTTTLALFWLGSTATNLQSVPRVCLWDNPTSTALDLLDQCPMELASSHIPQIPSWSRIRVVDHSDCENIRQLLEASYTQPQALNGIKEAVIKLKLIRETTFFNTYNTHAKPYVEHEQLRVVAADHPLHDTIRILDLAADEAEHKLPEDKVVKHLTWHDPSVREERQARLAEDAERWHVHTYTGLQDGEFLHHAAPLLLMHCSNIENLTYSVCPYTYNADRQAPYRAHILEQSLLRNNYGKLPEPHLQQLRHVRLLPETGLWYDDGRTYSHMDVLGQLRLFHRLPNIESLAIDGITTNGGADHLEHFPPHTSNLKSIHVGHSMLPSTLVAVLIRIPKHLEEFIFFVGGRDTRDGGRNLFSARTLGKALWDQRASLRRLIIDVDGLLQDDKYDRQEYERYLKESRRRAPDEQPYWYDEWFRLDEQTSTGGPWHVHDLADTREYSNTIGSLHDFEKLTHLSLGVKLLLGPPESKTPFRLVEALPKCLESLLIRGYTRGQTAKFDEAIGELVALCSEQLPALKDIRGLEECIPSADVEVTRRRMVAPVPGEKEEADYWELDEGDQDRA